MLRNNLFQKIISLSPRSWSGGLSKNFMPQAFGLTQLPFVRPKGNPKSASQASALEAIIAFITPVARELARILSGSDSARRQVVRNWLSFRIFDGWGLLSPAWAKKAWGVGDCRLDILSTGGAW